MKEAAWLARGRPNGGAVDVMGARCPTCGRRVYVTVRPADWNKNFCRGCDEKTADCYCPETRMEAIP